MREWLISLLYGLAFTAVLILVFLVWVGIPVAFGRDGDNVDLWAVVWIFAPVAVVLVYAIASMGKTMRGK
jgi:hypothetical protein